MLAPSPLTVTWVGSGERMYRARYSGPCLLALEFEINGEWRPVQLHYSLTDTLAIVDEAAMHRQAMEEGR